MIRVLMNGCNGKMGQVITRLCKNNSSFEILAGISKSTNKVQNEYPVYESIAEAAEQQSKLSSAAPDVVIDFSSPQLLPQILNYCLEKHVALVIGTTGLSDTDYALLNKASEQIAIFTSSNMSLGINVITNLAVSTAALLHNTFDIEIIEKHHNEKKDAPSGTAKMIANEINSSLDNTMQYVYDRTQSYEKRQSNEIGISSIRAGTIPGEHSIIFAGHDEIIEIKHTALSRDIFGKGALAAAEYIVKKNAGFYDMRTMLKELM